MSANKTSKRETGTPSKLLHNDELSLRKLPLLSLNRNKTFYEAVSLEVATMQLSVRMTETKLLSLYEKEHLNIVQSDYFTNSYNLPFTAHAAVAFSSRKPYDSHYSSTED